MSNICEEILEVKNQKGIHARAAAAFVKAIENMEVDCEVERIGQCVDGCSIMGLMMLAAAKGTTIKITTKGKDCKKAMDALKKLINDKFNEE